jgi:hypothetical protein
MNASPLIPPSALGSGMRAIWQDGATGGPMPH